MANLQVRNVPEEIMNALRAEADENGRSLQQQLLTLLDEHTAPTRRRAMFDKLDSVLGDEPVLVTDPAVAIREDRDERDARDAARAQDYA